MFNKEIDCIVCKKKLVKKDCIKKYQSYFCSDECVKKYEKLLKKAKEETSLDGCC